MPERRRTAILKAGKMRMFNLDFYIQNNHDLGVKR
jgi:hypothetical protein